MMGVYQDFGIRFEYPPDWDVDVSEDGPVATVTVEAPEGTAFAIVRVDTARPSPSEVADEALEAMRSEYDNLDASPALESIDGQKAVGYDVEFFSLDMTNACTIRAYRTPEQTVLIFAQWSQVDDEEVESMLLALRRSVEAVGV